jgi:hypothetical protein
MVKTLYAGARAFRPSDGATVARSDRRAPGVAVRHVAALMPKGDIAGNHHLAIAGQRSMTPDDLIKALPTGGSASIPYTDPYHPDRPLLLECHRPATHTPDKPGTM